MRDEHGRFVKGDPEAASCGSKGGRTRIARQSREQVKEQLHDALRKRWDYWRFVERRS